MSGQEDEPSDEDPEEDGDFPEDEPDGNILSVVMCSYFGWMLIIL